MGGDEQRAVRFADRLGSSTGLFFSSAEIGRYCRVD